MRKSIFIILYILFSVPCLVDVYGKSDAELQHLDSLLTDFEKNGNNRSGFELSMLNYDGDSTAFSFDDFKNLTKDEKLYEVYYAYSLMLWTHTHAAEALEYSKKMLEYALRIKDNAQRLGNCYSMFAACYLYYGLVDRAIDYYHKTVECSRKIDSYTDMAFDYANIACAYTHIHDYVSAKKYIFKSLDMLKEAEERKEQPLESGYYQSYIYSNAQQYYFDIQKYDKALEYSLKAYRYDSINNRDYEAHSRKYEQALILLKTDQEKTARFILEDLYQYYTDQHCEHDAALCLYYLERYPEALELERKTGGISLQISILEKLLFAETDITKLKTYTREYITLKDSFNSQNNTLAMQGFNAEYDAQQREQTIIRQKADLDKQRFMWYWAVSIFIMLILVIIASVRGWMHDKRNGRRISNALADLEVASQKLADSNIRLAESNKIKDKLIRVISHDLSGSTSNVNMLAHMVADKLKDNLSYMLVSQSENLKTFFDDLIIWVRMQKTGSIEIHPTNISLDEVVDDVIKLVADMARNKQINLSHTISSGTIIMADRSILHCIIRNLVNNAVKFTPRKGTITVSFSDDAITVTDTGVGMTQEIVEALLSGSQWVHTDGTEGEVGTGLGLSIVRDMLTMVGARLAIQSQPGQGSSFTIQLKH